MQMVLLRPAKRVAGSGLAPVYFAGRIEPPPELPETVALALAVNGTIRATTRTYEVPVTGRLGEWSSLLDERVFEPGENDIDIFQIIAEGADLVLARLFSEKLPYPER